MADYVAFLLDTALSSQRTLTLYGREGAESDVVLDGIPVTYYTNPTGDSAVGYYAPDRVFFGVDGYIYATATQAFGGYLSSAAAIAGGATTHIIDACWRIDPATLAVTTHASLVAGPYSDFPSLAAWPAAAEVERFYTYATFGGNSDFTITTVDGRRFSSIDSTPKKLYEWISGGWVFVTNLTGTYIPSGECTGVVYEDSIWVCEYFLEPYTPENYDFTHRVGMVDGSIESFDPWTPGSEAGAFYPVLPAAVSPALRYRSFFSQDVVGVELFTGDYRPPRTNYFGAFEVDLDGNHRLTSSLAKADNNDFTGAFIVPPDVKTLAGYDFWADQVVHVPFWTGHTKTIEVF